MSDAFTASPPLPPAPPPAAPGFDFVRPFAFVFEDRRWVAKILVGGLFTIASALIIGIFFLLGYVARLVRNVIAGERFPLPEWDDLSEYFAEGLRLFGVVFLYTLPIICVVLVAIVPLAIAGSLEHDSMQQLTGGLAGCIWCLVLPISLALMVWLPAALLFAIVEKNFAAAFNFGRIWTFIKTNIGNYLLAIVVHIVARFAAQFGVILFCVGVFFTSFWALVVAFYAFAEAYRLSTVK